MKSLLTQIKHAKITTREVLIHLRKNGGLKRKSYLKYLKMQYRIASDTYNILQSAEKNPNYPYYTPNEKKLTMPVHLVKSEISTMSKSFEDNTFLTEAWHFFQKEMMRKSSKNPVYVPVSGFAEVADIKVTKSTKTAGKSIWNNTETLSYSTNKNLIQTMPQSLTPLTPTSGFDKLNQFSEDPRKYTPLCTQILKWAQEGKLNLN